MNRPQWLLCGCCAELVHCLKELVFHFLNPVQLPLWIRSVQLWHLNVAWRDTHWCHRPPVDHQLSGSCELCDLQLMAGCLRSGKAAQIQTAVSWQSSPRSSWWWRSVAQLSGSACWWDPSPQPRCIEETAHPACAPVSSDTPLFTEALHSGSCAVMSPHHMAQK